jgi:hypothetical protein
MTVRLMIVLVAAFAGVTGAEAQNQKPRSSMEMQRCWISRTDGWMR